MIAQITQIESRKLRESLKSYIPCECNCGYTCGRQCGLSLIDCINQHYRSDCKHDFSGNWVDFGNGGSATCFKCGMTAISHDMKVGP